MTINVKRGSDLDSVSFVLFTSVLQNHLNIYNFVVDTCTVLMYMSQRNLSIFCQLFKHNITHKGIKKRSVTNLFINILSLFQ